MVIQSLSPGKVITLYLNSQKFRGELLVNPQFSDQVTIPLESALEFIPDLLPKINFSEVTNLIDNDLSKTLEFLDSMNYFLGEKYFNFIAWLTPRQALIRLRLAIGLLIVAIVSLIITAAPLAVSEFRYHNTLTMEKTLRDDLVLNPVIPNLPNVNDFSISIPKINLKSKIIPEVDPNQEDQYKEALKKGVAQAKGSYLPGQGGPVFLFAHSTDSIFDISEYDAMFFGVKDLKVGDEIDLSFEGQKYHYLVTGNKVVSPNNLTDIKNSKSDLILSTCFPPGTDWQRLLVFAKQN